MSTLKPTTGPGVGLSFSCEYATVFNRTGGTVTLGEIVMFDIEDTQTETTTTVVENADAGAYSNVITPTTAGIGAVGGHGGYFFGVMQDASCLDNAKMRVLTKGVTLASLTSAAVTIGDMLVAADAVKTLAEAGSTAGKKRLAYARQANGSAAGLFSVYFDGIHGFGATFAS